MKLPVNDNVKLQQNQKVMPFTLRDIVKEAKQLQPHYSLIYQLSFYVTYITAIAVHSNSKQYQFIAEQKLKLIKLIADGAEYAEKFRN